MVVYLVYGGLIVFGFAFGCIVAWLRQRRERVRTVIESVSLIVAQNLPLLPALQAASASETGKLRDIFLTLVRRLSFGEELWRSLRFACPNCPGEVIGAIAAGERSGTLPAVLRSIVVDLRRRPVRQQQDGTTVGYLLSLIIVSIAVIAFLMVQVVPKFYSIFEDFSATLPPATQALFRISGVIGANFLLFIGALFAAMLLIAQSVFMRYFGTRIPMQLQASYIVWDSLVWMMPIARAIASARAAEQQLPVISAALRAGVDLSAAARQAAIVPVNEFARRRLAKWAERMRTGMLPADAAKRCGMPGAWVRAVGGNAGNDDLPARLDYLTAYYRSIAMHWEDVIASIARPCFVFVWACGIGAVVYALFLPLVALLEQLLKSLE